MLAHAHRDPRSSYALPVCLGKENSNRLVSLWDIMKEFSAFALAASFQALLAAKDRCDTLAAKSGGGSRVDTDLRNLADSVIGSVSSLCRRCGFVDAEDRIGRVVIGLGTLADGDLDISTLSANLEQVQDSLLAALRGHKFLRVETERSKYLGNSQWFGDRVSLAFDSAVPDILSAGNCLAVELHTAAVFHFMRVAEHGLRALARTVGVKLKDKNKSQPIEFAEWDKIIHAVNNRIIKARTLPHGPKKSARISFYSEGAEHCMYLKELRNRNSATRFHTREKTTPQERLWA